MFNEAQSEQLVLELHQFFAKHQPRLPAMEVAFSCGSVLMGTCLGLRFTPAKFKEMTDTLLEQYTQAWLERDD